MPHFSLSCLVMGLLTLNTALAAPKYGPSHESQCAPRVVALATGIQINIVAQHGMMLSELSMINLDTQ